MTNKDTNKYKLKVGYTVFVGLVLFFLFIIMVGTESYYFSKTYNLNLLVKSTEGLIEGGKVSLGGLKIGQIDKIEFTTVNNENLVRIKLALLEKYSPQITVNSYAKIESSGLLGDKLINISLGSPSEKPLNEGDYLPVKESFSFNNIADQIEPLVTNIDDVFSNLKTITDTIKDGKGSVGKLVFDSKTTNKLNSILENLDLFVDSINKQSGTVGKLVYDDELYNNLTSLTVNLKSMLDSLKAGKGTLGKLVTYDSLYTNINELSNKLNRASDSLNNDSTFVGGLLNDNEGYRKLILLIDEMNKLITDIKNNPDRYINLSIF